MYCMQIVGDKLIVHRILIINVLSITDNIDIISSDFD